MTTGDTYERELVNETNNKTDWIAQRSTGSMGFGDVDIFSPYGHGIIVEVKSTKNDYFSTKVTADVKEQRRMLIDLKEQGFNVMYDVRLKGAYRGQPKIEKHYVYDVENVKMYKGEGICYPDFLEEVEENGLGNIF